MDALPQTVLYAFFPDRILTFEQIARESKRQLPYVRNTINKEFIRDGLVEEVHVNQPGNHFRLTIKGFEEVCKIHAGRQRMRNRIAELRDQGVKPAEAAKIAAVEAIQTDISVP